MKAAVAGELSKTFRGAGATDAEISEINETINRAQSPEQIQGAIKYYLALMGGKIQTLKAQNDMGMQGKPNFGGAGSANTGGSAPAAPIQFKGQTFTRGQKVNVQGDSQPHYVVGLSKDGKQLLTSKTPPPGTGGQ